jgi:hypothetical protein
MKLKTLIICLCLIIPSISGCIGLEPGNYKRMVGFRTFWEGPKIFKINQTKLLTNM